MAAPAAPVPVDELPPQLPPQQPRPQRQRYANQSPQRYDGLPPEYDDPPPPYDEEPPYDDDDAQTRVINGKHRRGLGGG